VGRTRAEKKSDGIWGNRRTTATYAPALAPRPSCPAGPRPDTNLLQHQRNPGAGSSFSSLSFPSGDDGAGLIPDAVPCLPTDQAGADWAAGIATAIINLAIRRRSRPCSSTLYRGPARRRPWPQLAMRSRLRPGLAHPCRRPITRSNNRKDVAVAKSWFSRCLLRVFFWLLAGASAAALADSPGLQAWWSPGGRAAAGRPSNYPHRSRPHCGPWVAGPCSSRPTASGWPTISSRTPRRLARGTGGAARPSESPRSPVGP